MDVPTGCDPAFCVVWFRFRLLRKYLALWPTEVGGVYRLLEMVSEGSPGHGPIHLLSASAAENCFSVGSSCCSLVSFWFQFSDARQLGCVFQDMKPPKSILWKCTDMPKPIQRVKFTKAIARHTKTRYQNPSLGYICPGEPHQRSPNAPKFEDPSLEETEWQEQGAREAAWKLAKSVLN